MATALQLREQFNDEIRGEVMQEKIRKALPKDVSLERFTDVITRAVQEDPGLLAVENKMSIFLACQKAAQDGLMPDKREGALITYSVKTQGVWQTAVQWQAMIAGLRKKLASLKDSFDIRAHVVYEQDLFDYDLGDNEQITHKPFLGDNKARGEIVNAYAIATRKSDGERWREVMNHDDIEDVKKCSKSGDKGPWGSFYGEMSRKTVAKRLIKTLPIDDKQLQGIIERDNAEYDMGQVDAPKVSETAKEIQKKARKKVSKKKVSKKPAETPAEPIEGEAVRIESENPAPPEEQEPVSVQPEIFKGIDPGF